MLSKISTKIYLDTYGYELSQKLKCTKVTQFSGNGSGLYKA